MRSTEVDIRTSADGALEGLEDPEVLRIAADRGGEFLAARTGERCLYHFAQFAADAEIVLIWAASDSEDWINRLVWISL